MIRTIATADGGQQVQLTTDELAQFQAQQSAATEAQAVLDLKNAALAALAVSDLTAIRCIKAGMAFPAEWQAYVSSLRAIVNTGTGTLPTQPAFPAGT